MPVTISGTNGVTFPDSSLQAAAASPYVLKNRIINGDMRIDQRNAGASVTVNSGTVQYGVDRFGSYGQSTDGVFTVQRSTNAPTGFINSLIATVTTSDSSIGATQEYGIQHNIEGLNTADLSWGTANAQTVTLSFWVRSSVTGLHSGSLSNSAYSRSYVFSYTINSANTWEQKTVTIAGDTSGTWLTDNGIGIRIRWNLGSGSTYLGTANSWSSSFYDGATSSVQLISTNGATFYITGVQLEVGTSATPFERRLYGQELALCQRYYYLHVNGNGYAVGNGNNYTASQLNCVVNFPVTMRGTPTLNATSGTDYYAFARNGASDTFNSFTIFAAASNASGIYNSTEISGTAGQAGWILTNNASSYLAFQAEL